MHQYAKVVCIVCQETGHPVFEWPVAKRAEEKRIMLGDA